jgi:hypothetical protein
MAATFTMAEYEDAERALAGDEGRRGFVIHAVVTLIVWAIVIPINVFVADAFPWSAFVVAGMSIGLAVHDVYGVRLADRALSAHQRAVESLALVKRATSFGTSAGAGAGAGGVATASRNGQRPAIDRLEG